MQINNYSVSAPSMVNPLVALFICGLLWKTLFSMMSRRLIIALTWQSWSIYHDGVKERVAVIFRELSLYSYWLALELANSITVADMQSQDASVCNIIFSNWHLAHNFPRWCSFFPATQFCWFKYWTESMVFNGENI